MDDKKKKKKENKGDKRNRSCNRLFIRERIESNEESDNRDLEIYLLLRVAG